MNQLYVLCNQYDQFFTKSGEWNNGDENKTLFRSPNKDEAINQKVELTVKHPELRIRIVVVSQNERGALQLPHAEGEQQSVPPQPDSNTQAVNDDAESNTMNSTDTPQQQALV